MKFFFFCIFFHFPHQVDMKNVVECPREFIAYFNALETTCGFPSLVPFDVLATSNGCSSLRFQQWNRLSLTFRGSICWPWSFFCSSGWPKLLQLCVPLIGFQLASVRPNDVAFWQYLRSSLFGHKGDPLHNWVSSMQDLIKKLDIIQAMNLKTV